MKKDAIILITLFLVGLLFFAPQAEAGRLNFMLINMTEDDIVDVRISPTYAPQNSTDNLLYTRVEPNRRLYVGPNLYGHKRYWNIQIRWASGLSQNFTRTRLTRYNTYLVYTTPKGVRLRQSYERVFARYQGKPAFENVGNSLVGFGESEKENVKESVVPVFASFLREVTCMRGISAALNVSRGQKSNRISGTRVVAGTHTTSTVASERHYKDTVTFSTTLDNSTNRGSFAYRVSRGNLHGHNGPKLQHALASTLVGGAVQYFCNHFSPPLQNAVSLAYLPARQHMGRSHFT